MSCFKIPCFKVRKLGCRYLLARHHILKEDRVSGGPTVYQSKDKVTPELTPVGLSIKLRLRAKTLQCQRVVSCAAETIPLGILETETA